MPTDAPLPPPGPRRRAIGDGVSLGRIGGIPIGVSWSWLASVALITVLAAPVVVAVVPGASRTSAVLISLVLAVLLGVSVLAHELGHCLVARLLGIGVLRVRLYILGGVSELSRVPTAPGQEAAIAAAGPGVSLGLGALSMLLMGTAAPHTLGWLLLLELAVANAAIALFNILPALPLDGGRVLRAGVWRITGRRRFGTSAAVMGGYVIAAALVVYGLLRLTHGGTAALLLGAIALVMAVFMIVGAAGEQRSERSVRWPSGLPIASAARPVLELPVELPLELARQAAAGRAVILTAPDGVAVGLLDDAAAAAVLSRDPRARSDAAVVRLRPEMVLLADDDPDEVVERVRAAPTSPFLLVDADGRPVGVVDARQIGRVLSVRPEARFRPNGYGRPGDQRGGSG